LSGTAFGQSISRFEFLEKVSGQFLGKPLNEVDAMQSGLLSPLPDGKFHLDWPMTRAEAARVMYALVKAFPEARSLPAFFPDVPVDSALYPMLSTVGGVFQGQEGQRFCPDLQMTIESTDLLIQRFAQRFPESATWENVTFSPTVQEPRVIPGRRYQADFAWRDATATARIEKLLSYVPSEQIAPQTTFELRTVAEAMTELEGNFGAFEKSITALTTAKPTNRTEVRQTREGMTSLQEIVAPLIEKLKISQIHLESVLLTDSESLRLCADLKIRLKTNLSRLIHLKKQIDESLQHIAREDKTP
jgi:hypothetical protein